MRIRGCLFITCLLLIIISNRLYAQNENSIQFYNLNEEYGISLRETNQVCSDDNGFIWISSKMGIIRYTQDDIRVYQLPYETTDVITVRLIYCSGVLYSYTNNGQIFKYNAYKDRFELEVNIAKMMRNPYLLVSGLLVDENNRLWISSTSGLFYYTADDGLKSTNIKNYVYSMAWDGSNKIVLAIFKELKIFDTESFASMTLFQYPDDEVNNVSLLFPDFTKNGLWIGTMENGLYFLKRSNMALTHVDNIPNQPILTLEEISDSTLLIGVDGQGVWEIDKSTFRVLSTMKEDADNPGSLKGNGVYDIYKDKNNRVWVCTYSGGVSYFNLANPVLSHIRHVANNSNSLVNDDVNDVMEDSSGNLWFATNNGISFFNISTHKWKTFYHNNEENAQVFLTLSEDNRGFIWAGTYSSGVYVIDSKDGKERKHLSFEETKGQFRNDYVFDIIKDRKGDMWIGGVRGDLILYDTERDTFKSFGNFTVGKLVDYKSNKLLIGTSYGLVLFDKNTGESQTLVEGNIVYDVLLKDGMLWICTSGNGLISYNIATKEEESFTVDDGLPSNFVTSIEFVDNFFWIGTEQGLCRFNEKDKSILTFNALPVVSNVSYNKGAIDVLKNGRLICGTNQGALSFDPQEIKPVKNEGSIFLQELAISGRSVRELEPPLLFKPLNEVENLSLKYFQNTISLEMIPIGVISPGAKFSWKIEELDEDWTKPVNSKILSYSNIASGNYTLRIRMYDSSNTRILAERKIDLKIIPPFWQAWWFRVIVIIFVFSVIIFTMVYYIDHLKKIHSEEKIRFFANTAHDIRTSLTLINGPIEELNKETRLSGKGLHYLHLATEQTQRLLNVVTQLMDFQKSDIGKERISLAMIDVVKAIENRVMMFESYARGKNIEIRFSSNSLSFFTAIDETLVDKVVDNLISNAIKYSYSDTEISVNLQCSESKWVLEVKDQGIGISKKAQRQLFNEYYRAENVVNSKIVGSGIGLLLVKNYVNLHEGKISCDSQLNQGSSFQVAIPTLKLNSPETELKVTKKEASQPVVSRQELSPSVLNEDDVNELNMKVLIVEDNEYLREFLKSAMEPQFQVYLAEDGEQAWKSIQKKAPDLIVSDIVMPNMDGFELCRKVKSTYETSHLPVILLTALAGKAEQLKGLGLGADDYLTKPFDVSILQQRIRTVVKNREMIREKALKLIKVGEESVILENEHNDKFLKHMIEVVHKNISNAQFSKNDFAFAMNVSPSLLYKKIKSLTDQSPTDFIKAVRLNQALDLLRTKKYTITEVSELCGFASVGYFSTVFRKHFGKSPTQMIE